MASNDIEQVDGTSTDDANVTSSAGESQSTASANETSAGSEEGSNDGQTVLALSREELVRLISDATSGVASDAASAVGDSLTEQIEQVGTGGVVTLTDEQYQTITSLQATQLHGSVMAVGLLSLLLGAVIATAVTLHWRGRG